MNEYPQQPMYMPPGQAPQMPPHMQPQQPQYQQPQQPQYQQPQQPQYAAAPGVSPGMPVQSMSHNQSSGTVKADNNLTIGPFILNFPKLFRPEVYTAKGQAPDPTAKPKYGCELWLYRSSPHFDRIYAELGVALNSVSIPAFSIPWDSPQFAPKAIRWLNEKSGSNPEGIFIRASSTQPPRPVVKEGATLRQATEQEMYSGCEVYALLNPAPFERQGKKLKWWLNGIWKTGDGERLLVERDPIAGFSHLLNVVQTNYYPSQVPQQQDYPPQGYPAPPQQQDYPPQGYPAPPQQPGYPQQGYQAPQQLGYPQHQVPQMPGYPQ